MELEWPIEGFEPLSFVLTRLLEPLSTRLERCDRGAAALHVVLGLITRVEHRRRLELPSPMRDVRALRTLALLDLESHPPEAAIDRVTVTIDPTPGRILQHTLFARPHPTPEQVSTLLARLGALMGQDRIGAAVPIDSHRPDAFAMKPFPLEHGDHALRPARRSGGSPQPRVPSPESRVPSPQPRAPSPEARVPSPERVVAALRRYRQPVPARVAVDAAERPVRVGTDRTGLTGGTVTSCAGPWRTSGEWWIGRAGRVGITGAGKAGTPSRADEASGWDRDEWDVALADGAVYRIFRDRAAEAWFVDGVVD